MSHVCMRVVLLLFLLRQDRCFPLVFFLYTPSACDRGITSTSAPVSSHPGTPSPLPVAGRWSKSCLRQMKPVRSSYLYNGFGRKLNEAKSVCDKSSSFIPVSLMLLLLLLSTARTELDHWPTTLTCNRPSVNGTTPPKELKLICQIPQTAPEKTPPMSPN